MAKAKRSSSKRDTVNARNATMYAKRDGEGQFREMDEKGRSQTSDRRRKAKKRVRSGYGDQGDQSSRGGGGAKRSAKSRKRSAKKSTAKRSSAKRSTAKRSAAKRSTSKRSSAKRSTASSRRGGTSRAKKTRSR